MIINACILIDQKLIQYSKMYIKIYNLCLVIFLVLFANLIQRNKHKILILLKKSLQNHRRFVKSIQTTT